jgi:hypothetical protein
MQVAGCNIPRRPLPCFFWIAIVKTRSKEDYTAFFEPSEVLPSKGSGWSAARNILLAVIQISNKNRAKISISFAEVVPTRLH